MARRPPRSSGRIPWSFSAPEQGDGRPTIEHVNERVSQAIRDGHARFEWLNMRNGQIVRMLVTLIPVAIDGGAEVLVLVQDMTATSQVVDAIGEGPGTPGGGRPHRADRRRIHSGIRTAARQL